MSTRPAPPRGFMQLDRKVFELVAPDATDILFPRPAPGYATCVTDAGRRYCAWLDAS